MSDRIPRYPLLSWLLTHRGWVTVLDGHFITLQRNGVHGWWLMVGERKVPAVKTFCDGAQIASLLPRYKWRTELAVQAERAARHRHGH